MIQVHLICWGLSQPPPGSPHPPSAELFFDDILLTDWLPFESGCFHPQLWDRFDRPVNDQHVLINPRSYHSSNSQLCHRSCHQKTSPCCNQYSSCNAQEWPDRSPFVFPNVIDMFGTVTQKISECCDSFCGHMFTAGGAMKLIGLIYVDTTWLSPLKCHRAGYLSSDAIRGCWSAGWASHRSQSSFTWMPSWKPERKSMCRAEITTTKGQLQWYMQIKMI